MKPLFLLILFSLSSSIFAQDSNPKKVVDDFFTAFHAKDTVALRELCHPEIVMRTVANTKEGYKLKDEKFDEFLNSIATIPANLKIFEKLLDYKVEIDGNLAHVWTPYEFYVNDKLSHIGANAFTLYNDNGKWQIIHLIDTRRKKSL
ncbi:MAG: nuclear transport factor 2 family protein [Flavobacterium sp.]|uniref:nuclear transport factor 2 family protein n=1 Tax=Flavobacterium sp. TaxID=239 RepID=UPI0025BF9986|nr:nuclear transport factor 2 family protein [Flavobacterium sp.]MCK6608687.1 nuclear transport factor 2 family protein [Flavobacterium sp.]